VFALLQQELVEVPRVDAEGFNQRIQAPLVIELSCKQLLASFAEHLHFIT
jgi:hypothetical protein